MGLPGHAKHEHPLFAVEQIDKFHPYILTTCPDCHGEVSIMYGKPRIIQQVELIEVPLIREEHHSYPVWCPICNEIHYMPFPRLRSIKAELYVLFKIDKSRGSKVLIDVLGKEFNGVLGCDYFSAYRLKCYGFSLLSLGGRLFALSQD